MKSKYLSFAFLLLMLSAGITVSSQEAPVFQGSEASPPERLYHQQIKSGGGFTEWYNYGAEIYGLGGNTDYYYIHPWADSTVYVNFTNGLDRPYIHSIGQVFDPLSQYYEANHPVFSGPYSIDSIAVPYRYFRFQNGAPDTMVIQIFKHDRIYFVENPGFPNGASYSTVSYDTAANRGTYPSFEVKVPLTMSDTAMADYRFHYLPVGIVVQDTQKVAVTYTYIPGNPYSANDTVDAFLDPPPGNRRNALVLYEYYDRDLNHEAGVYNHAFLATTPVRYNYSNGWNSRYLAGSSYSLGMYHLDVNFLVSNPPVTIGAEEARDLKLEVYPNPTSDILFVSLPSMKSSAQYELCNAAGQVVLAGNLTNSKGSVEFSSLDSGIYSLRVLSEEKVYTEKIVKL